MRAEELYAVNVGLQGHILVWYKNYPRQAVNEGGQVLEAKCVQ